MQQATAGIELRTQKGVATGHVILRAVTRSEAIKKGVTAWLSCWGIAVVTIPIPLVHFVAPPALLLLGPLAGFGVFKMYNGAVDITGGEAPCPDCSSLLPMTSRPERWPYDLICLTCSARSTAVRQP